LKFEKVPPAGNGQSDNQFEVLIVEQI